MYKKRNKQSNKQTKNANVKYINTIKVEAALIQT